MTFAFIVYAIPVFAPIALVIAFLFIRLAPKYVKTARDLRRLESVSLSPAFAGFDEVLKGLAHIRAFAMEERYEDAFFQKLDTFQGFDHVYVSLSLSTLLLGGGLTAYGAVARSWLVAMAI